MKAENIGEWVLDTLDELTRAHWLRNTQGETKALDDIRGCCETAIKLLLAFEKQPQRESPPTQVETPTEIDLSSLSKQTIQELLNAIYSKEHDIERLPHQDNPTTKQIDQPPISN